MKEDLKQAGTRLMFRMRATATRSQKTTEVQKNILNAHVTWIKGE